MIKIIMHGCNGKMGQVITKIAEADSKVEIVAGVDQFQGVQNPYPVFSSMEACDAEADFTRMGIQKRISHSGYLLNL